MRQGSKVHLYNIVCGHLQLELVHFFNHLLGPGREGACAVAMSSLARWYIAVSSTRDCTSRAIVTVPNTSQGHYSSKHLMLATFKTMFGDPRLYCTSSQFELLFCFFSMLFVERNPCPLPVQCDCIVG
jgi:hypothetical protein